MSVDRHPAALTIAGSDSSGGAGIQADLKTFAALGVYGASVITALTAQNTRGVSAVQGVTADFIAAQFNAVVSDLNVSAMKTGMLGDAATVEIVSDLIGRSGVGQVIVDPVMVATSGDVLLAPDAIAAVRERLIPRAMLITPNIPEAAKLLGLPPAVSLDDMRSQAVELLRFGCGAVLVKGGHGDGGTSIDVLATRQQIHVLSRPRIDTVNTHGTGCTLSAAITAGLVLGMDLIGAVTQAKEFVWKAIRSGARLKIGSGNGPVDHEFARRTFLGATDESSS